MSKKSISVKDVVANPGEKVFGYSDIRDSYGTICPLPVGIINGSKDGPTLLLTAGVHGCEYTGIDAASRLYRETDPEDLNGAIVVVTCMNIPALRMRVPFVVPFDDKNLNRSFPGSSSGTAAEVISHFAMTNLLPLAEFLVDCHAGDIGEILFDMTISNQTDDDRVTNASKALANGSGLDYSYLSDARTKSDGTWVTEANKAGVPSIVVEIGYDGRFEQRDRMVYGRVLRNILKHVGLISGAIERESDMAATRYFRSLIPVKVNTLGLVTPLVDIRDRVKAGQVVAEVKDLKGDVVEEIRSSEDALVLMFASKISVKPGDSVFYLCRPE